MYGCAPRPRRAAPQEDARVVGQLAEAAVGRGQPTEYLVLAEAGDLGRAAPPSGRAPSPIPPVLWPPSAPPLGPEGLPRSMVDAALRLARSDQIHIKQEINWTATIESG